MPRHVALLRGVNVGQNLLKMDRLRALAEELGYKNVTTYVQSGNLIFDADGPAAACSAALERKLAGVTRLPVKVLIRSPRDLETLIARNPFLKNANIDRTKLHVTFLAETATKEGLAKLAVVASGADEFRPGRQEICHHCPNGYGRTRLSNNAIERALGVSATTRNWNTVNKLLELATQ